MNQFIMTLLGTLLGVGLGGWITYRFSKYYYEKAAREMETYVGKIKGGIRTLARYLEAEAGGKLEIVWDQDGDPINISTNSTLNARAEDAKANFSVSASSPEEPRRTD